MLNHNRQYWYTMANLPYEYDFLAFRTIRPLLVLTRFTRVDPRLIFSHCTELPPCDLVKSGSLFQRSNMFRGPLQARPYDPDPPAVPPPTHFNRVPHVKDDNIIFLVKYHTFILYDQFPCQSASWIGTALKTIVPCSSNT